MNTEKKQEFTRRISQANSTDMVIVIYDIAIAYIDEAKDAYAASDKTALEGSVIHIRKSINELIASLNYEYSPSGEMLQLYIYCSRRLTALSSADDAGALDEVRSILSRLREAYARIADTNKSGPIMSNSESVYAGLTYGRGTLNENIVGNTNRGFLA